MAKLTLNARRNSQKSISSESIRSGSIVNDDESRRNDQVSTTDRPVTQRRRASLTASLIKLKKAKKPKPEEDSTTTYSTSLSESYLLQLPVEIQLQVLAHLDSHDVLYFRQVCKTCLHTVNSNPATVVRYILNSLDPGVHDQDEYDSPDYTGEPQRETISFTTLILSLYQPPPNAPQHTFLLALLRHHSHIKSLLSGLLSFIQTRVYMLKLTARLPAPHFAPYRTGLNRRLYVPLFLASHFLSSVASHVLYHHSCSDRLCTNPDPPCPKCRSSLALLVETSLDKYPTPYLISMYHVLRLLYMHLLSALQPPSSIGPIERRFRGWGYGPPPEHDLAEFMIFGGTNMLRRVDEMRGSYSRRLETVRTFVEERVRGSAAENSSLLEEDKTTKVAERRKANWVEKNRDADLLQDMGELRLGHITCEETACMPQIEGFLLGEEGLLAERIRELNPSEKWCNPEDLETMLGSPYPWLTRLMSCSVKDADESDLAQNAVRRMSLARLSE